LTQAYSQCELVCHAHYKPGTSMLPAWLCRVCQKVEDKPRVKLRVGSCAGVYDAPIRLLNLQNRFSMPNVVLEFVMCPDDAGAMVSMMSSKLIDVVIMSSEDAVAQLLAGNSIRVCGTFVASPRSWGIYTSNKGNKGGSFNNIHDLISCTFMVPSGNSAQLVGAIVMRMYIATVDAKTFEKCVFKFKPCDSLEEAKWRSETSHERHVFIWEASEANRLVASGEWSLIQKVVTPWPAYLIMASRETLHCKGLTINKFIEYLDLICNSFKINEGGYATNFLYEIAHMSTPLASLMLHRTDWKCSRQMHVETFEEPLKWFKILKWVEPDVKYNISKFIADGVTLVGVTSTVENTEGSENPFAEHQDHAKGELCCVGVGHMDAAPAG